MTATPIGGAALLRYGGVQLVFNGGGAVSAHINASLLEPPLVE